MKGNDINSSNYLSYVRNLRKELKADKKKYKKMSTEELTDLLEKNLNEIEVIENKNEERQGRTVHDDPEQFFQANMIRAHNYIIEEVLEERNSFLLKE